MKKQDTLQKRSHNSGATAFYEARQKFVDLEKRNENLQTQIQALAWLLHIASIEIWKLKPSSQQWKKIATTLETRALNKSR